MWVGGTLPLLPPALPLGYPVHSLALLFSILGRVSNNHTAYSSRTRVRESQRVEERAHCRTGVRELAREDGESGEREETRLFDLCM